MISVTFQRIDKPQLVRLLGGVNDSVLAGYAKLNGWEARKDGTYFVANHEANIKTRNIEEKLKFEGRLFRVSSDYHYTKPCGLRVC